MLYDVSVNIDLTKPIGKQGFGVPLILVEKATKAVEYTEVTTVAEVVTAGFAATTTAYKAAQLLFAQTSAPKKVAICAVTTDAATALADASLISREWRQLIVVSDGEASAVSTISTAVEALDGKMYFAGLDTDDDT
jgi:hypothetical protein